MKPEAAQASRGAEQAIFCANLLNATVEKPLRPYAQTAKAAADSSKRYVSRGSRLFDADGGIRLRAPP